MTSKFLFITVLIISLLPTKLAAAATPSLLITELQTGLYAEPGGDQPQAEFIEMTNSSPSDVVLGSNWRLDYLSAANDGTTAPTSILVGLAGTVPAGGHILASFSGYLPAMSDLVFGVGSNTSSGLLAKTGGHVRLMNGDVMVDCLAWGSAVAIAGCQKLPGTAPNGASMQRILQVDLTYSPVGYLAPISPQGHDGYEPVIESDPEVPTGSAGSGCGAVLIDEIEANPAGDDTGREFIELYNPTQQTVSLQSCGLQVGTKIFRFDDNEVLAAGQFNVFYSSQTNLVLTNGGGSVQLLGSNQPTVAYPELLDDQVWALVDASWQVSNQPTPNGPNLANDTAIDGLTGTKLVNLTACPAGKQHNPKTGRCINMPAAAAAAVCAADQVRNPQTGRCKKLGATSIQKACVAGQERSPETQRCRKIVSKTSKVKFKDNSAANKTKPSYLIMMAVGGMIVIYGVYEYRRELSRWTKLLKGRVLGKRVSQ